MTSPSSHGFMVLHSNRLEGLRYLMVSFMQHNPLPPLAPEVLLVQSNGMKHWLELSLAQSLGVCAATRIELPSTMLWQIYRQVLGPEQVPARMPLDKAPMVWRLMRLLPELLAQPVFEPLSHYLQANDASQNLRLYQLAQQLADVYDGYQNYRSDWLDDWAQGHAVLRDAQGRPQALPAHHAWQAALWRALQDDLQNDWPSDSPDHAATPAPTSRSHVHQAFLRALRDWPEGQPMAGLPPRLMVFGITSLPMQTVEALAALGRVCQVLMWVHNPCQEHWGHVVEARVPLTHSPLDAAAQYTLHTEAHPLLAAWGKHGRDYLHLIDGFDDTERYRHRFQRTSVFIDPVQEATDAQRAVTQLAQLQSAVLHLSPLPEVPLGLAPEDDSISLHMHYSAQREVEVLHDHVLAWLDADPSLQASDIMVMVPDMASFAPHIHAVFGRFAPHESRHVPYHVADTPALQEPLIQTLSELLQLPQLRVTRAQWQSWFEVAAVRQRYGLDEADVTQLAEWLNDAAVRWGLDAQHRSHFGIDATQNDAEHNSWLFGLQRLLLGYAQGDHVDGEPPIWQHTLAVPGVGGLDAPLIDGLLQWLQDVVRTQSWLQHAHTPSEWVQGLQALVHRFFLARQDDEVRLIERVLAPLAQWRALCETARLDEPVPLAVVREHWLAELDQAPMHRRFFGGGVQFATLMPMRTIPFRIVCLLGMNDGDYPRQHTPRDFDLMSESGQWRAGDRSRREDDRYLFLEAVLSARERLYLSWQGKRTTDHAPLPPSVLVAQLCDYLDAGWQRKREPTLYPLQPFSTRYFSAGSGFHTYANDWQAAHTAVIPNSTAATSASFVATADARWPSQIQSQQLWRLLRQSVDVFWVDRLQVQLDVPQADAQEHEPFSLDGLSQFVLGQDLALCNDADLAQTRLRLSGVLALGGFGDMQMQKLLQARHTLRERWDALHAPWPHDLPPQSLSLPLEGGPTLEGQWADQAHPIWRTNDTGKQWLQVQWRHGAVTQGSEKKRQPRLDTLGALWLNHLMACASGTPTTSCLLGLDAMLQLPPLSPTDACAHLYTLMRAWQHAWQAPLLLPRQTACAWLLADPTASREHADAVALDTLAHELTQHLGLQRVVDDTQAVLDTLHTWASVIYGPIQQHVRIVRTPAHTSTQEEAA